jgi:cell division protein FtsW (lipid II flippase)
MPKGCLTMDINKLKNDYQKIRVPKMDISIDEVINVESFIKKIKNQDREDEKYLLHNQIIPLIVGLVIMIILMLINPIKTVLMLTGMFMIFGALLTSLILRFADYRKISKETYDLSLSAFLKHKEERLESWRSTPSFYKWIFTVFVTGLIFMVIGNTAMMRDFGPGYILLFIAIYLILFISAWTIGEHFFRKRHEKKHQPLIKNIVDLLNELAGEN